MRLYEVQSDTTRTGPICRFHIIVHCAKAQCSSTPTVLWEQHQVLFVLDFERIQGIHSMESGMTSLTVLKLS